MIKTSLDRISGVFEFDTNRNDVNFELLLVDAEETFRYYASTNYFHLDVNVYGGFTGIQIYLVNTQGLKEPLINIQILPYQNALRFDWNPKRFRELNWAHDALNELFTNFQTDKYINAGITSGSWHITQADIAFDLIDESTQSKSLIAAKLGSRKTMIMNDRSGALESIYYGSRGSDSFARKYNKSVEQRNSIHAKYKSLSMKALKDVNEYVLSGGKFQDIDEIFKLFKKYEFTFSFGYNPEDVTSLDVFNSVLKLELEYQKSIELSEIPDDWWRFEFVLRVQRISKTKKRQRDNYKFDPQSIIEWIESLTSEDYVDIDDPQYRAITLAVNRGEVDKKELPQYKRPIINNILKYNDVTIYRSKGNVYSRESSRVPNDDDIEILKVIKRGKTAELIKRMKEVFLANQSSLIDELNSYFY